jgi:hypothetical protein
MMPESFDKSRVKLDMILLAIRMTGVAGIWFFIGMVVVLAYWNLEPDPLHIEATPNNVEWATCKDREFEFERRIVTSKYLEVQVSQYLIDLSTGAQYGLPAIAPYSGAAGDIVVRYKKQVPWSYREGAYEYKPVLTYQVNPIKTITKAAPSQKVLVNCKENQK